MNYTRVVLLRCVIFTFFFSEKIVIWLRSKFICETLEFGIIYKLWVCCNNNRYIKHLRVGNYILIILSGKCLLQNCAENRLKIYIIWCQKTIGLKTKHKLSTHHVPNWCVPVFSYKNPGKIDSDTTYIYIYIKSSA